jgi:hypothetical protein
MAQAPGDGWSDWCSIWRYHSPYRHRLVEAWRREWQTVEVLCIAELPRGLSGAGLYWRPLPPPAVEPEVARRLAGNCAAAATRTARTHKA